MNRQPRMTRLRIAVAVAMATAAGLGATSVDAAPPQTTSVTIEATFTGPASAVGVVTIGDQTGAYQGQWQTIFDGNGVPRAVVGEHQLDLPDGEVTVHFSAHLAGAPSPAMVSFDEHWSVRDASGAYDDWRGSGFGTTVIGFGEQLTLSTTVSMRLP